MEIRILKNYLRMRVLKIKFENWNFEKLFENGSFENWNFEELFESGIFLKKMKIGILKNYLKIKVFGN